MSPELNTDASRRWLARFTLPLLAGFFYRGREGEWEDGHHGERERGGGGGGGRVGLGRESREHPEFQRI